MAIAWTRGAVLAGVLVLAVVQQCSAASKVIMNTAARPALVGGRPTRPAADAQGDGGQHLLAAYSLREGRIGSRVGEDTNCGGGGWWQNRCRDHRPRARN